MNFRSLEYFQMVAEEGSIRQAAQKLYISEQSLSEAVKKLEAEVGTELFIRSRPYQLTKAGEIFAKSAKKILNEKKGMLLRIEALASEAPNPRVMITVGPMGVPVFLPQLLSIFKERYPQYDVEIVAKKEEHLEFFSDEELCFLPVSHPDDKEHLFLTKDRCVMVISKDLLKKSYGDRWQEVVQQVKKTGDILLLQDLPFIDWKQDKANCFLDAWMNLDRIGFHPKILSFSRHFESNLSFCEQGLGVLFSLENMLEYSLRTKSEKEREALVILPLQLEGSEFDLTLTYVKDKVLTEAEKAFIEVTQDFFHQ